MGDKGWRRKGGRRSYTLMEGGTKIICPTSAMEKRDGVMQVVHTCTNTEEEEKHKVHTVWRGGVYT